jgi:hypothetical protein
MSEDLTAKQRDAALQQWRSLITRECRDLSSLERISARALQDRDIRADAQLLSMVQAELERRRAELQRKQRSEQRAQPSSKPPPKYRSSASRPDRSGRRAGRAGADLRGDGRGREALARDQGHAGRSGKTQRPAGRGCPAEGHGLEVSNWSHTSGEFTDNLERNLSEAQLATSS